MRYGKSELRKTVSEDGLVPSDTQHHLSDFEGRPAIERSTHELKTEVQNYAVSAMPEVLRKMVYILQNSGSNKDAIEAAKFIKSVADGEVSAKVINQAAKRFSNEELAEVLNDEE